MADQKSDLLEQAKSMVSNLVPAEKSWVAAWVISLALLVITNHLANETRSEQTLMYFSALEENRADENRRLHDANQECNKTLARIAEREQRQSREREVAITTLETILNNVSQEELTNEKKMPDHDFETD